jgi:hypothetical protein
LSDAGQGKKWFWIFGYLNDYGFGGRDLTTIV